MSLQLLIPLPIFWLQINSRPDQLRYSTQLLPTYLHSIQSQVSFSPPLPKYPQIQHKSTRGKKLEIHLRRACNLHLHLHLHFILIITLITTCTCNLQPAICISRFFLSGVVFITPQYFSVSLLSILARPRPQLLLYSALTLTHTQTKSNRTKSTLKPTSPTFLGTSFNQSIYPSIYIHTTTSTTPNIFSASTTGRHQYQSACLMNIFLLVHNLIPLKSPQFQYRSNAFASLALTRPRVYRIWLPLKKGSPLPREIRDTSVTPKKPHLSSPQLILYFYKLAHYVHSQ